MKIKREIFFGILFFVILIINKVYHSIVLDVIISSYVLLLIANFVIEERKAEIQFSRNSIYKLFYQMYCYLGIAFIYFNFPGKNKIAIASFIILFPGLIYYIFKGNKKEIITTYIYLNVFILFYLYF